MLSLEERRKQFNIPNDPILAKNKTLSLNILAPNRKTSIIRAYIRVSTLKQKVEGQSLDAQEAQIREHCERHKIPGDILLYPEDAVSGRVAERPEFTKLCNEVQIGDVLIAYSLSRFGRNMHEIISFLRNMKDRYIRVVSLKEDWNIEGTYGDIILAIMAGMSQIESDLVRERTCDTMRHLKETGRLRSKPKFGYKYIKDGDETKIALVEDEQKVINFILALITGNPRINDSEITRRINHEIKVNNLTFKGNNKIYQSSVRNIIINNNLRNDTNGIHDPQ